MDVRPASEVAGKCILEPEYDAAVKLSGRADQFIDDGDYVAAMTLLDQGIGIVGTAYYSEDIIDDTGMKLVLSHIKQEEGVLAMAANLRSRVLSSRLAVYGRRLECKKKK